MRFIHNRFPISSPFQSAFLSYLPHFCKKSISIFISSPSIIPVKIKCHSPLMHGGIGRPFRFRNNPPRLSPAFGIQFILLFYSSQTFPYSNGQSLFFADCIHFFQLFPQHGMKLVNFPHNEHSFSFSFSLSYAAHLKVVPRILRI